MNADVVAREFRVDLASGLPAPEADRRLAQWGANRLPETVGVSWAERLREQFTQFLVLVLLAAALVSLSLGEYLDAGAILGIVVLNGLLGFAQEYRAERALQALRSLTAPAATVRRDGRAVRLPAHDVVPGDLIELEDGDLVAADARLVSAVALRLNEAVLTGESAPVDKTTDSVPEERELPERASMVYQGTLVVHGRGAGIVVATGERTQMGRIAASLRQQPTRATPLQRRLADTGRWLVYGASALCLVVFLIGLLRGAALSEMFLTAASLAVAAIPEGLPAATTIVLALGVQRMARRNAIVRRLAAVETLGSVTVVCADKTGTLTQNRMEAQALWVDGTLVGMEGGPTVAAVEDSTLHRLLLAAVLCNDASQGEEGQELGDPTETALLTLAARLGMSIDEIRARASRVAELPFDAQRARMTVVCRADGKLTAYTKGAPEVMVPLSSAMSSGGIARPLDAGEARTVLQEANAMAERGMRVLAFGQRAPPADLGEDEIERDLTLLGLVGLADPLRPEARPAIEAARRAGVRTVMLTGDHPVTAAAIGRALGISPEGSALGRDIEELPDSELREKALVVDIYARVSSEHKLRLIEALRTNGEIVAMTGDGVNDAPALHSADVGVAMGRGGTDVAREASDIVLLDNNFRTIIAAIEEGRTIFENIRKFVHYLLTCNFGEILVVFLVLAFTGATALLPLQILFVNLLTDGLPALALGREPPEPGLMQRPPRPPAKGILGRESLVPLVGIGALVAGPALLAYAWGRAERGEELARQLAFATLVGAQLAASFQFRSATASVLRLRQNAWLLGAVVASIVLLAAAFYLPFLQEPFHTEGLSPEQWAGVFGLSVVPFFVIELAKLVGLARRLEGGPDAPAR